MGRIILFFQLLLAVSSIAQTSSIIRGPYLQLTGSVSTFVCWKTSHLSNSKVVYGTSKNNLALIAFSNILDTNHVNYLPGLLPNTKYYYTVNESSSQMSSDTFYFYTAPPVGSGQKIRFLALGDCGTGYTQQYNVKAAINDYIKGNYINGVLLLGDNAYASGLQNEYQTGFFDPYKTNFILGNSCIYASPGNHDYGNNYTLSLNHQIPYYEIFKTPQSGELGGFPSNHKEFYSFNYANVHFISLDSYGVEQSMYHLWDSLGPQYQWLEQDLQQDHSMWKIVYFHHPPFTMGSHNSDTESDLVLIRRNIARLLEKYGVDLVINGHSHTYERSWLQKGHYDLEASFNKAIHTLDSSSARYDGSLNSCPYKKDTSNNTGTIYVVAGESGKIGTPQASYPHDSKYFSETTRAGALFFEVEGNRLDAFYLEEDSLIHDKFTILKNVNRHQYIPVFANQSLSLSASWIGNYNWLFSGSKSKIETVTYNGDVDYIVNDSLNCLSDTFSLRANVGIEFLSTQKSVKLFPNPVKDKIELEYLKINEDVNYEIINLVGEIIQSGRVLFLNGKAEIYIPKTISVSGNYFLNLKISEKTVTKPFFMDR